MEFFAERLGKDIPVQCVVEDGNAGAVEVVVVLLKVSDNDEAGAVVEDIAVLDPEDMEEEAADVVFEDAEPDEVEVKEGAKEEEVVVSVGSAGSAGGAIHFGRRHESSTLGWTELLYPELYPNTVATRYVLLDAV